VQWEEEQTSRNRKNTNWEERQGNLLDQMLTQEDVVLEDPKSWGKVLEPEIAPAVRAEDKDEALFKHNETLTKRAEELQTKLDELVKEHEALVEKATRDAAELARIQEEKSRAEELAQKNQQALQEAQDRAAAQEQASSLAQKRLADAAKELEVLRSRGVSEDQLEEKNRELERLRAVADEKDKEQARLRDEVEESKRLAAQYKDELDAASRREAELKQGKEELRLVFKRNVETVYGKDEVEPILQLAESKLESHTSEATGPNVVYVPKGSARTCHVDQMGRRHCQVPECSLM